MNNLSSTWQNWQTGNPAGGNLLRVSWLEGQFRAAAFRKGSLAGTWEAPPPVTDIAGLEALLHEAAARTGAESKQVAFVLAHSRLSAQALELPPTKGRALERFLQRRVGEIKAFDGEAVWSQQPALAINGARASLVHLFPAELLNRMISASGAAGLQLVRVLPSTAVLSGQLKLLPLEQDEVALLAAETGPAITVVIGRNDGRLCLGRMLGSGWKQNPEAVAVELTRTIGFAEQQAGVAVGSVWLFGDDAPARAAALQPLLRRPVKASPLEAEPFYWAGQAGKLPEQEDGNLISPDVRQAPQRRVRLKVTAVSLLVLLLASIITAAFVEKLRRDDVRMVSQLEQQISEQQEHQAGLNQQIAEAARKSEFVRVVRQERLPPVPAQFLSYLGSAVPDDLALTRSRIVRTNDFWLVRLEGSAQPAANGSAVTAINQALATLTNQLASGPFHMTIARCQNGPAGTPGAFGIESTAEASPAGFMPAGQNHFLIEGVIR